MNFLKSNFIKPSKDEPEGSKPRIQFIDLAKGVCIILVVIFHSGVNVNVPNFDALRMPLYFILSGLFFKDYGGLNFFLEKKINKLIIPFAFFFFLSFFVIYVAHTVVLKDGGITTDRLLDPVYSRDVINISLWFLLCLFWCNLIYYLIHISSRSLIVKAAEVIIFSAGGIMLGYHKITLPLYMGSSLVALPFFYMGILLGGTKLLYPNKYDRYSLLLAVLFLGCAYAIYFLCDSDNKPIMSINYRMWHNNILLVYINSMLMVMGTLMLCKTLTWMPVVSYMGRYSIMILVIHFLILGNLAEVVELMIGYSMSPRETLLYTLLLCWLLIPVMKKYMPGVTAQKDWLKLSKNFNRGGNVLIYNYLYLRVA